jgi:hypothetical protein
VSGHTPGPWRAARRDKTSNFGGRLIRIDNWPSVPRIQIAEIHYREGNTAPEANAALMAAAPDLADALEALSRHSDYIEALPGASGLADLAKARAALRKAGRLP